MTIRQKIRENSNLALKFFCYLPFAYHCLRPVDIPRHTFLHQTTSEFGIGATARKGRQSLCACASL